MLTAIHLTSPAPIQGQNQAGPSAESVPERLNFANGLFRSRRFDLAAKEYEQFLATNPPRRFQADALFGLANARHFLQEYEQARNHFQKFLSVAPDNHPNRPTALFRVGELAYVLGDLEAAADALERYAKQNPKHRYQELAWPYLGDVRLRQNDLQGARQAYETALADFPDGRLADRARYYLGRTLAELGPLDAARDQFQRLIDQPDSNHRAEAIYRLGRLELDAGRPEPALQAFRTLETEAPQSSLIPRAKLGRAEALSSLKRFDEAQALLKPLLDDPSSELAARAAYELGLVHLKQGQNEPALSVIDQALEQYPNAGSAPALLFRSAEAAERLGNPDDALERFERLASTFPDDPWSDEALVRAASLALESGQNDRAKKLADQVAQHPKAGEGLVASSQLIDARADLDSGQPDQAISTLEALLKRSGADPETEQAARYYLGLAYRAAGKPEQASTVLEALTESPSAPFAAEALYLVGQGHFEAGRHDQAIKALRAYLDKKPDGQAADHALARIALASNSLGQLEKAQNTLKQLAEQFPESPLLTPTRLRLAEAALDGDRPEQAIPLFQAVVDTTDPQSPMHPQALSGLGWAFLESDQPEPAAEAFGRLVADAPDHPLAAEAAYLQAWAWQQVGQTDQALTSYRTVIGDYTESDQAPKARLALARLLTETGQPGQAAEQYAILLENGPPKNLDNVPNDRLLAEWAWALLDAQQFEQADTIFQRLLDEHPDSPLAANARLNLAESAFQGGQFDRVQTLLQPIVADQSAEDDSESEAENPEVAPRLRRAALFRLGRTFVEQNQWGQAAKTFDQLLSEFSDGPFSREAKFWAAEVAYQQGNPKKAEAGFAQLIEQFTKSEDSNPNQNELEESDTPQTPDWLRTARLRRVQCLVQLERWSDALKLADQLKADAPQFAQMAELDYARGRALQSMAPPKFDEAREAYQAVIDARKGTALAAQAQFMIGETYFHQKDYEQAIRGFMKVEVLYDAPKWQAMALLEAGKVYERLDRWADAADIYEQLRSNYPEQPASAEADRRLANAKQRASA